MWIAASMKLENLYNPDIYEAPGCTLQASGAKLEPEAFLRESNFPQRIIRAKGVIGLPEEVREKINKGELPYRGVFDIFDMPFILIRVSEQVELSLQLEEATLFLKRHLDDVKRLHGYPNVENILMQFLVEKSASPPDSQNLPDEFSNLYSESGIQGLMFGQLRA